MVINKELVEIKSLAHKMPKKKSYASHLVWLLVVISVLFNGSVIGVLWKTIEDIKYKSAVISSHKDDLSVLSNKFISLEKESAMFLEKVFNPSLVFYRPKPFNDE